MDDKFIHPAFFECFLCAEAYESYIPFAVMASSPQNVRNELVLSEPRQSSMVWIAEMTEFNPHDFSCFCFFGVLDIGEIAS